MTHASAGRPPARAARSMWRLSCAGATVGAVSALALGFASPARADGDPAGSPPAPATAAPAPAVPVPPTPPVVATQVAPANVNVDIRIGSPGDNGSVTQTIATIAAAAGAPPADTGSAAANPAGSFDDADGTVERERVDPRAKPRFGRRGDPARRQRRRRHAVSNADRAVSGRFRTAGRAGAAGCRSGRGAGDVERCARKRHTEC